MSTGPIVTFAKTGLTVAWDQDSPCLLEFAEDQGLSPDFGCRGGICTTCRTAIKAGSVSYVVEPAERPEAGFVLLCCSQPDGNITLDL